MAQPCKKMPGLAVKLSSCRGVRSHNMWLMTIQQARFPSARGLAAALWVLQRAGHVTRLGMLEEGPMSGQAPQGLRSEALRWAERLNSSQTTGLETLDLDAPELSDLKALRAYLDDHSMELGSWLEVVAPTDERESALPTLMSNLRSLRGRASRRPVSETFFVVPTRQMRSFRIGPAEYVLTRDFVNTSDVFAGWAKRRHRVPEEPLLSVLACADTA